MEWTAAPAGIGGRRVPSGGIAVNIAQIRYFVTAAQLQNLSKAAESLHLSQPSLSRSIAKLEAELGTPLFERRGKKVTLNESGRRFLESARVVLRELDNTALELQELTAGSAARLSVGIFEAEETLTDCVTAYARTHPEVEFELHCAIEAEEALDINKYDMLLCPADSRYGKFRGAALKEEPYLLAVPAAHPLAARAAVLPRELERLPFVFLSREKNYIEEPFFLCAGLNLRVKARCFTDSREQHRQIVASGVALGFVPEGCAGSYRADGRIRLLPISSGKFCRRMMLCFKRRKHLSAAGLAFQDFVLDYFGLPPQRESTS